MRSMFHNQQACDDVKTSSIFISLLATFLLGSRKILKIFFLTAFYLCISGANSYDIKYQHTPYLVVLYEIYSLVY